ncbi:MAG TPA: tetratricopeptide repeat protein [Burkholderiaceae bacterium]|nr:tetratricopeptide repeat protein [Burkholderiaceae bacterium]
MPTLNPRTGRALALPALLASLLLLATGAHAQDAQPAPAAPERVENSAMNAPLFQQLLIGEIELREGDLAAAYQLILDAARRTKNEQLFRRATDIALQARAGDEALAAVKAWRLTLPDSVDALRYQVQLLVQLNRTAEVVEPLRLLIKATPATERPALISALPRLLVRSSDHNQAAQIIEQVLLPYADAPETRVAARVAIGRGWLAAINGEKALALARSAHELDRSAEAPAGLALEMMPGTPAAEEMVKDHLAAMPGSNAVRLLYVRTLLASQRLADATGQLETLTQNAPNLAQAWLILGALHVQLREPVPATAALQKYIALVQTTDMPAAPAPAPAADADEDDAVPASKDDALTRGYLLLSQAADQQGDFKGAEAWLAKIDNPKRALEVQARRASLLAREGKVAQARELIRRLPEKTPEDARAKVLAEAQVLRDAKLWRDANDVLTQGNKKFPDDVDLIYEQSMMAEKLNRLADMERLLRRVIELKPDHQQAYNALGYSLAERNLRLPEARSLIKKALELSPGEPSITDSLGWVEYRLGNRDEAVRLLREAYRGQPDAEIAAHLGEVLWVNGQTDEARRIFGEARKRDADNDVLRETLARLRVDL